MNIGFDAKRAFLNNSGLGNYSRTLIKSLYKYYPTNSYHLYSPKVRRSRFYQLVRASNKFHIHQPEGLVYKKLDSVWRSYGMTDELIHDGLDIYHGLSNELPINIGQNKATKKIVTIHDLIFLRYPRLYSLIDRTIYNYKFKTSCEHADLIVAASQQTKDDILHYYNIAEDKIKVVHQSCADSFYEEEDVEFKKQLKHKYCLPNEFLLYVGTVEERKNLMTVVKALKLVKEVKLVILGKRTSYFDKVQEYIYQNNLQNRVIVLSNVDNNELPYIYRLATVFIYPSLYEGFGIPVLEAMVTKTPVITSNVSCMPEIAGPHSLFVEPMNEYMMAEHIAKLFGDTRLREEIAQKSYDFATKFHSQQTSKNMMEIYQSLL